MTECTRVLYLQVYRQLIFQSKVNLIANHTEVTNRLKVIYYTTEIEGGLGGGVRGEGGWGNFIIDYCSSRSILLK